MSATPRDAVVTSYRLYPTGWTDAVNAGLNPPDRFGLNIERSRDGMWAITRGNTLMWSETKQDWIRPNCAGTIIEQAAYFPADLMGLEEAWSVAQRVADTRRDLRGETFADFLDRTANHTSQ